MQTVVDFFMPPPEVFVLLAIAMGMAIVMIRFAARAAAKACAPENRKKLLIGTGKVAGKAAGKIAWKMFRQRIGM